MKAFRRLVAVIAIIMVTVFLGSLVLVIASDGRNELAAEICSYSLIASFVVLVLYEPKGRAGH